MQRRPALALTEIAAAVKFGVLLLKMAKIRKAAKMASDSRPGR
jgi:hypothetical protein